jgi:hypothetical protein
MVKHGSFEIDTFPSFLRKPGKGESVRLKEAAISADLG